MTELSRPVDLEFDDIVKYYGNGRLKSKRNKLILDNIDISIKGGKCLLVTGQNGCGKSTLLRILGGVLKPNSLKIKLASTSNESYVTDWKQYRKWVANEVMYLYQEPYMFDGSVRRNLRYALSKNQSSGDVEKALEWAELTHRENTQSKVLSGGERQRVALAQAFLKQPAVLLLDEPTANMDTKSRERTETLLERFKASGTALCIASHDPNHFHRITDQCLQLVDGKLIR